MFLSSYRLSLRSAQAKNFSVMLPSPAPTVSFNAMGSDGRSVYVLSSLLLDTIYPILYTSLILGAYSKLFKSSQAILFLPITAFSFDILENIQITMLNLNFPNINKTHVYFSSMTTSAKWIAVLFVILILIYGIIRKKKK